MISEPLCISWLLAAGVVPLLAQVPKAKGAGGVSEEHLIQLAIWGSVLLLMIAVGAMVVRKLRESATQSRRMAGDLLSNFQEMRREGDISDAEFRNIQSVLGNQPGRNVKGGKKTL